MKVQQPPGHQQLRKTKNTYINVSGGDGTKTFASPSHLKTLRAIPLRPSLSTVPSRICRPNRPMPPVGNVRLAMSFLQQSLHKNPFGLARKQKKLQRDRSSAFLGLFLQGSKNTAYPSERTISASLLALCLCKMYVDVSCTQVSTESEVHLPKEARRSKCQRASVMLSLESVRPRDP